MTYLYALAVYHLYRWKPSFKMKKPCVKITLIFSSGNLSVQTKIW